MSHPTLGGITIPFELSCLIYDEFRNFTPESRFTALKVWSQVCHSFRIHSLKDLFASVTICCSPVHNVSLLPAPAGNKDVTCSRLFLIANALHILPFVSRLTVINHHTQGEIRNIALSYPSNKSADLVKYALNTIIPQLTKLNRVDVHSSSYINWLTIDMPLRSTILYQLCRLSTIRRLYLDCPLSSKEMQAFAVKHLTINIYRRDTSRVVLDQESHSSIHVDKVETLALRGLDTHEFLFGDVESLPPSFNSIKTLSLQTSNPLNMSACWSLALSASHSLTTLEWLPGPQAFFFSLGVVNLSQLPNLRHFITGIPPGLGSAGFWVALTGFLLHIRSNIRLETLGFVFYSESSWVDPAPSAFAEWDVIVGGPSLPFLTSILVIDASGNASDDFLHGLTEKFQQGMPKAKAHGLITGVKRPKHLTHSTAKPV